MRCKGHRSGIFAGLGVFFYISVLLSLVGTAFGFFRFYRYRSELLITGFAAGATARRLLLGNILTAVLLGGSYFSCTFAVASYFALFGFSFLNTYALCSFLFVEKSVSFGSAFLICLLFALCQILLCISSLRNAETSCIRFIKTLRESFSDDKRAFWFHVLYTALFLASVLLQYRLL